MSVTVEETITALEHALWVVDQAVIDHQPTDGDDSATLQTDGHAATIPATEALQEAIRPSKRGVARVGLTVRLWLALLIVAAMSGRATVARMHKIATGNLPRDMQWELGILTADPHTGAVRQLTAKQLYDMAEKITEHLDIDPARNLPDAETRRRVAIVHALSDALVQATHVLPQAWTSYAVDESGVWAWVKGKRKPAGTPDIDPADEDSQLAEEVRELAAKGQLAEADTTVDDAIDEDYGQAETAATADAPGSPETSAPDATAAADTGSGPSRKKRAPLVCWLAKWGVKTHKTGKRSSYYGYALHVLIRVPDVIKGGGKGARTQALAEPLLIEQMALTSASTDIVDVTLAMIEKVLARGHKVVDLIGDRHYSYKKFDRWLSKLWALGVRQVHDLRQDDHGVVDYNGAQIIAGTPHCGVPDHLVTIERPGKGATQKQLDDFTTQVEERQKYAMFRNRTPWQNGDGKTRWRCAARNGTAGCPRVQGSVEAALKYNLPIVTPPESELAWCKADTASIEAGPHMKYQQQEYWGLLDWLVSWNRRTYVEGSFGNIKNHNTGNVHRGFMCFTGMPLVTFAVTAAVVAYNLRELESRHDRASKDDPNNPLLSLYAQHPLHQRTSWQHGFSMLTAEQAKALDDRWLQVGVADEPDELPEAA